jgi:hypothetical protein
MIELQDVKSWQQSCADLRAKIGSYDRRDIPKWAPIIDDPNMLVDPAAHLLVDAKAAIHNTRALILKLEVACSRARQMGVNGHWSYSKPLHEALFRAWLREKIILQWQLQQVSIKRAA